MSERYLRASLQKQEDYQMIPMYPQPSLWSRFWGALFQIVAIVAVCLILLTAGAWGLFKITPGQLWTWIGNQFSVPAVITPPPSGLGPTMEARVVQTAVVTMQSPQIHLTPVPQKREISVLRQEGNYTALTGVINAQESLMQTAGLYASAGEFCVSEDAEAKLQIVPIGIQQIAFIFPESEEKVNVSGCGRIVGGFEWPNSTDIAIVAKNVWTPTYTATITTQDGTIVDVRHEEQAATVTIRLSQPCVVGGGFNPNMSFTEVDVSSWLSQRVAELKGKPLDKVFVTQLALDSAMRGFWSQGHVKDVLEEAANSAENGALYNALYDLFNLVGNWAHIDLVIQVDHGPYDVPRDCLSGQPIFVP